MKKSKLILIIAIIAVILLGATLCLLLSGYTPPAPKATEAKIPDGWEAVSTENNVTFIQMKEGENKHVWLDRDSDEFYIDVVLPKNKDYVAQAYGDDEYIEVIVYYGYGWLVHDADQGMRYIVSSPNPDSVSSTCLTMEVEDGSSYTLWEDSEFVSTPSVEYREKGDQIGYTKAAIVKIPTSVFAGSTDTPVYFRFRNAQGTALLAKNLYFTHDTDSHQVIAETVRNAREQHIEHSFPWVILTFFEKLTSPAGFFQILSYAVMIATPIVTIVTAIKGRKRHYPYLIISAYILLTLIFICCLGDSWAGVAIFLLLVYYIIPGAFVIAILQLIVNAIMRTRAKRNTKNQTTTIASVSTNDKEI
jgi:hypothetical protein